MKPGRKKEMIRVRTYTPVSPGTIGMVVYERWVDRPDRGVKFFTDKLQYTNMGWPVLRGWLGTTNNRYRESLGVFIVVDFTPKAGPAYLRWTSDEAGWVRLRQASEEEVWEWLEEQLPERWGWRMRELVENAMGRLDMG